MTKMDMVWVAVASLLHPAANPAATVSRTQIDAQVERLFGASITPVMLTKHLVSSEARMADEANPSRGGSRNRYLFRTTDGQTPSRDGGFRLWKLTDGVHDGWEKTGPTHPDSTAVAPEFRHLVDWYKGQYVASA